MNLIKKTDKTYIWKKSETIIKHYTNKYGGKNYILMLRKVK